MKKYFNRTGLLPEFGGMILLSCSKPPLDKAHSIKALYLHWSRAFLRSGAAMQPNKPLTKRDERRTMQELEQKRQAKTPGHADPAWMAAFYRRMAS